MPQTSDRAGDDTPELTERFYQELHDIAVREFASERAGHTLQPTAAVNEACLRLLTTSALPDAERADRVALASRVLRQVLIDHARARDAQKRGGDRVRVELDPETPAALATVTEVEALNDALTRLRALHERQARVVELRLFGGLTMAAVAAALGVSKRTVEDDWAAARAWLRRELAGPAGAAS